MNIKNQLLQELLAELYPSVDDGTGDDTAGGGGGGGSTANLDDDDDDDEPLGEQGVKTLKKVRKDLRAAERRLSAVEGLDPKVYKEATAKAELLERELREREALTAADKLRLEQKANSQVTEANEKAEAARKALIKLEIRTAAKTAFELAKGLAGADEDGLSFFDGFMSTKGDKHLRIDDNGKLYVVDDQGDPVQSDDGTGRISPAAWMKKLADKSPVIGTFFQPAMGSGSGMGNSRGQGGRNLPALKDLTPGQRRDLAWNSSN
jgi:hypothetical protein